MREILFRGKRVDNGEWVYGYAVKGNDKKYQMFIAASIGVGFFTGGIIAYEVIPKTVGQYTGLTDKNGKKIFEGDILLKGFEKVLVKWNENQCRWGIYSNNYEICGFNESTQGYFEVIGNIYDNHELLEVEK